MNAQLTEALHPEVTAETIDMHRQSIKLLIAAIEHDLGIREAFDTCQHLTLALARLDRMRKEVRP